jgi:hypothetical protein
VASTKADRKSRRESESKCAAIAEDEALDLLRGIRSNLAALEELLATAQDGLRHRASSPKQTARLRLIHDDLVSATKFAAKLTKD